MDNPLSLKELTIGILTWRTPVTLENTLASYRKSGLLEMVGETIIFINECHPNDIRIAEEYGLKILSSDTNIGIGRALSRIVSETKNPYFLFLENDWLCVENQDVVAKRLQSGLRLIKENNVDVLRYRHRTKFGQPLYSMRSYQNNEIPDGLEYLLDAVHWIKEPEKAFPQQITKKKIDYENWFFTSSANANFTNNPCLYNKGFFEKNVLSKSAGPGIALEVDLQRWWKDQKFQVAQGEGLFEHKPLEISGKGYNFYYILLKRVSDFIYPKIRFVIAKIR